MSMTVIRRKDTATPRVFMHKGFDIPGGVSIKTSELGGDYIKEGCVLAAPVNGICNVVKVAVIAADVQPTEKTLNVEKFHNLNVGDFVMLNENSIAAKVTKIDDTSKEFDTLTISEALGAIPKGGAIVEAKAASSSSQNKSELKYKPFALVGTGKVFDKKTNIDTDAWTAGLTKGNPLPECVAKHLNIANY